MAARNLQESRSKMKLWYDRKTKSRSFDCGDRVLVLFPVVINPLQAKYSGPYKGVKKISRRKEDKCVTSICSKHIMKNQNQNK